MREYINIIEDLILPNMTEKQKFVETLKFRIRKFAIDIILFCNSLEANKASSVITYQLIKSATSAGANYRAACRARSKKEFFSKLCIVVEEADETEYWLELIKEIGLSNNPKYLEVLRKEALEILKILGKAKNSVYLS